jgi:hypothetical protein
MAGSDRWTADMEGIESCRPRCSWSRIDHSTRELGDDGSNVAFKR